MKHWNNFFSEVKSSVYDPVFYHTLKDRPLGRSVAYFYKLVFICALFISLLIAVLATPAIFAVINPDAIASYYPQGLEVTIKGGQPSINQPEPYAIKMPANWKDVKNGSPENLLVINTKEKVDLQKLQQYHSASFLGADGVLVEVGQNDFRAISIAKIPDTVITQEKIIGWYNEYKWMFGFVAPILFIAAIIGLLFAYSFYLFYLLMVAFVIWLVAKLVRKRVDYRGAYSIGLHALTLPILLELLFQAAGIALPIGAMSLVLFAIVYMNLGAKR